MANLDNLIQDIYAVLRDGVEISDDKAKEFGDTMANLIKTRLAEPKNKSKRGLRLSSVGKPLRQQWYEFTDAPKEDPVPHQKIKFLYGDIIEAMLLFLTEVAGHTVEDKQKEVEIDGIKGHQDAKIDGVIVDIKSVASPSFYKFDSGGLFKDDPFGYVEQISSYCYANKIPHGAFLACDKQLGKLALLELKGKQLSDPTKRIAEAKEVISSKDPPPRCYEPVLDKKTDKYKLPLGCSYCPFKMHCYDNKLEAELVSGKPVWYLTEEIK